MKLFFRNILHAYVGIDEIIYGFLSNYMERFKFFDIFVEFHIYI